MTMPVIAIIVATICRIECKEIRKQTKNPKTWWLRIPEQAVEDFMKAAKCFLKPNYLCTLLFNCRKVCINKESIYSWDIQE